MQLRLSVAVLAAGCLNKPPPPGGSGGVDAGGPACLTPTFSSALAPGLGSVGLTYTSPWLSDDERDLLFARGNASGSTFTLLRAHRDDPGKGFDPVVPVAVDDTSDTDNPFVGDLGRALWFDSNRAVTGTTSIYEASGSFSTDFGPAAVKHDELGAAREPALSHDGMTIYYASASAPPTLRFATRIAQIGNFTLVAQLGTIDAESPSVAGDGTTIVFTNQTNSMSQLYQATIEGTVLTSVAPLELGPLVTGFHTFDGNLSSDGQTLVFSSDATGTPQIYIGKRVCN